MEDKELQELLDAKRWQLENQRQQEAIASHLGHHRVAWPWWLGTAAAAALLAAVLLSPVLFRNEGKTTPMIAEVSLPKSKEPASAIPSLQGGGRGWGYLQPDHQTVSPTPTPPSGRGRLSQAFPHTPPSALRAATPSNLEGELADAPQAHSISATLLDISTTDSSLSTFHSPHPRVHTRRSNHLADIRKAPEKNKVPALIAHYLDIPDTVLFTSNIVINLK